MKKLIRKAKESFCSRPVLWLTVLLLAATACDWTAMAWYETTAHGESIVITLLLYFFDVLTGEALAPAVIFPLLLTAINLLFLVKPHLSGKAKAAEVKTELYSLIYCGTLAATHSSGMFLSDEASGFELIPNSHVIAMTCTVLITLAMGGYCALRAGGEPWLQLSGRARGLIFAFGICGAAACILWSVTMAGVRPTLCFSAACVAAIDLKLIREAWTRYSAKETATAESIQDEPSAAGNGMLIGSMLALLSSTASFMLPALTVVIIADNPLQGTLDSVLLWIYSFILALPVCIMAWMLACARIRRKIRGASQPSLPVSSSDAEEQRSDLTTEAADAEASLPTEPAETEEVSNRSHRRLIIGGLLALAGLMVYFTLPLIAVGAFENSVLLAPLADIIGSAVVLILCGMFMLLPAALTIFNVVRLFLSFRNKRWERVGRWVEGITMVWGLFCTLLWCEFNFGNIRWTDWQEQLYNAEVHSPIATWTMPTIIVLLLVSLVGYLVLRLSDTKKLPPLTAVLSIAALYIGAGISAVWILQTWWRDPVICAFSFNVIFIFARVIRDVVVSWRENHSELPEHKSPVMRFFARIMNNSAGWPVLALVLALPLLGIIIALLTLFGQAPDSIIQAWTQTSDWSFSQQVSPPNLHYDEHYLCTVAASGHRRVVKPIRKGRRHGHEVTVNRQLCIANAFEQLLEERMPRFHSAVRSFYDKYGYPIARHIKTPLAADVVWVLMKPLEWLFLAVLYLFDAKPENRIAVQYPHAPLPDLAGKDD